MGTQNYPDELASVVDPRLYRRLLEIYNLIYGLQSSVDQLNQSIKDLQGTISQVNDKANSLGRSTLVGPSVPNILVHGLRFMGYTSSGTAPLTNDLPTNQCFSLHENTAGGLVFLAYNLHGTIKTVQFP